MKSATENSRRKFIGNLAMAAGATAGLSAVPTSLFASQFSKYETHNDADEWFKQVKGAHKVVFDAPEPHGGYPFIWPWVFLNTNNQSGTADADMTAMVVLRHNAMPFALEDSVWAKYKLGEVFQIKDNNTGEFALRNTYYKPQGKDFPAPGIDGLKNLQDRGAMFCVCKMAISVYGALIAQGMGLDATKVIDDLTNAVLPGVQLVPSGVWALGRAQQNGCAYIYAGG